MLSIILNDRPYLMFGHVISAWKQVVLLLVYSPTGQQRSSTPQCSSPTRSAIEPALLSAPCNVLSSHRPPQQRRRRWSRSGQLCSSPRSEPSGPAEKSKRGQIGTESSSLLSCSSNELHSPPKRCQENRALCAASRESVVLATEGTCTSLSGNL